MPTDVPTDVPAGVPTDVPAGMLTDVTRIHLTRSVAGTVRLRGGGGAFRVMLLERRDDGAVIAVVPERALLIAGDDVAIEVVVDPGLRLEITETGGTVAYDMRGGSARWAISYRVGAGAVVVHETWPWVSAEGSHVVRSTDVDLEADACLLLRETLVLGRFGEAPGRLVAHTHVRREGREVLVEELRAEDLSPGVGVGHRALDQYLLLGPLPADDLPHEPGWTRLELASRDVVLRQLALG